MWKLTDEQRKAASTKPRQRATAERNADLISLYQSGMPIRQISKQLGMTHPRMYQLIHELGLPLRGGVVKTEGKCRNGLHDKTYPGMCKECAKETRRRGRKREREREKELERQSYEFIGKRK